ncbi:hypothetical protein [Rhizobium sp. AN80A]|uniref:hypothetical protein n=1 Tax=Rhizobium sp. AN80A TaxID=3040673 RepID=UPI0024B3A1C5|nr:hypothetical protein [Rhizobium sp. AN80A]
MNIHHGSLFPDPFGAAQYCNDWLLRKIKEDDDERKFTESAKIAAEAEAKASRSAERAENAVKEAELASEAAAGTTLEEQVTHAISLQAGFIGADIDAVEWAKKIIQNYAKLESVDWVRKESTRANVKKGLSRQLTLLGAGNLASRLAEQLVEIFDAEYRNTNNLNFEGKGKQSHDFFAAARPSAESNEAS